MTLRWMVLMLGVASAATAQNKPGVAPSVGRQLYLSYCAPCHGLQGKGDGPAAPSLRDPIPDLTLLSQRLHGEFPKAYVRETIISGRKAHGSPEMPTWGPIFRVVEGDQAAGARINALVKYLEEIQVH